jgi:hypothetical protein
LIKKKSATDLQWQEIIEKYEKLKPSQAEVKKLLRSCVESLFCFEFEIQEIMNDLIKT